MTGYRIKLPTPHGDRFMGRSGLYVDQAEKALIFPTKSHAAEERCGREIIEEIEIEQA